MSSIVVRSSTGSDINAWSTTAWRASVYAIRLRAGQGAGIDDGAQRPGGRRPRRAPHPPGSSRARGVRGGEHPGLDGAFVRLVQPPVPQEEERLLDDVLRLGATDQVRDEGHGQRCMATEETSEACRVAGVDPRVDAFVACVGITPGSLTRSRMGSSTGPTFPGVMPTECLGSTRIWRPGSTTGWTKSWSPSANVTRDAPKVKGDAFVRLVKWSSGRR